METFDRQKHRCSRSFLVSITRFSLTFEIFDPLFGIKRKKKEVSGGTRNEAFSSNKQMKKAILKSILILAFGVLETCSRLDGQTSWRTSEQIARVPSEFDIRHRALPAGPGRVRIQGLKAVLLGAPIDGDTGSWTRSEIDNLKKAAAVLRANNVQVFEFYTPQNNWEQIKQAASGAHFLLYRGHGVYDGSRPPRWVGGFALKSGFFSSDQLKTDLHLAPGAIVMLYGCFTAGNSGFDMGQIDEREAKRRVAMYSLPFMQMGASGYYANWFGDAFASFIAALFDGKTLGESYKSYNDFNESTVSYGNHPDSPANKMWVDHDVWDAKTVYNNAFVGQPDRTIQQLFAENRPVNPSENKPVVENQDNSECVSAEESQLISLIMSYRRSRGLPAIRISRSLSRVARAHVRDLDSHNPTGACNMHSWSGDGRWTACCYTRDHAQAACMWNKPKELSRYTGTGFEISAGSSGRIDAATALRLWQGSAGHNSVIVNEGQWRTKTWRSIGAGMYNGYSVVWFGAEDDPEGEIPACR